MYRQNLINDIRKYQSGYINECACLNCDYYGQMAILNKTKFLWGKFWLCILLSSLIPVLGIIMVTFASMFGCFDEKYVVCPKCRSVLTLKN